MSRKTTSVARLSHHFHVAELAKLEAQLVAGQLLVVHHHRSHRHSAFPHAVRAAVVSGISILAQVPCPCTLVSLSEKWSP